MTLQGTQMPVPILRPQPDTGAPQSLGAPIRIRTGHSYHVYFTIALGQSNARFVERAMTPLNRYLSWADSISFLPEPGFEAIHAWNAIPQLTRRPYVVTFEDYLPRMPDDRRIGWLERRLRDDLLSARCRGIIAISEYALRQFRQQHRNFPDLPRLLEKIELVYPAVAPRTDRPKSRKGPLKLLFVGRDFMRKGGPVLLRAHRKLRRAGVPVQTTVVSSLAWTPRDYVGPPDAAYVDAALRDLDQVGIMHHPSLPPKAVYDLMDAADYLVFPTFHDTFGFVSIEALASGTPVIATDTCVLPEIIRTGRNGYLLPFDNDRIVGKWSWLYRQQEPGYLEAYEAATDSLSAALFERLADTWDDRALYEELSAGAVDSTYVQFHPQIARRRLEAIYERFRPAP
ncbi:glycosyltransferase family 4 protein [Paracoccus rhizosphaerae]|uniref:Glycosyltransferase family 4 protein n=1 Tax=Paracoccus rhizosphaerae TaxID=1133347 RepID=A0ABV6CPX2_9RHOB|nr:glycosyltransferase family 4 protein [Paracoccus rhizosphaerae]